MRIWALFAAAVPVLGILFFPPIQTDAIQIFSSPTPKITSTLKPSIKPSAVVPLVKSSKIPKTIPNAATASRSAGDYIMNAINDYRGTQGLSAVKTDLNTCSFAKIRALEISTNFSHSGFESRIGTHTLPYSGYHFVTENIAMTSNYKNVVSMWINSPGHAANMRADTPFVCVEKYGDYYAYEGLRI